MGKKGKPIPRDLYLGEWMEFFDVGPVELSKAAHCSSSYVSNIKGERRADVNVLFLLPISEHLGVSVNDLYTRPPSKVQIAEFQPYSKVAQASILERIRQKRSR